VAVRYIHRFPNIPDSKEGVKERAGFKEAYYIDVKKNMSKPKCHHQLLVLQNLSSHLYGGLLLK
jgi:hypothetical protein